MTEKTKEHEYCLRCGRKLKNEQARLLGFGETCRKKMQVKQGARLFDIKHK